MTHVEMIIDYVVDGDDFQYSDNHGVLIRCKDCKYFDPLTEDFDYNFCDAWAGGTNENMFCGFAERRQDADSSGNMSGTQKALKCTETHSCDYQRTETHEPQRMRGKWIEREVTHIDELEAKDIITAWQSCKCSVCGRYDTRPYMYYFDEPKYCSWCGADMRGTG